MQNAVSRQNSSTTTLASGATFTGSFVPAVYPSTIVSVKTDQAGTLYVDFSPDGTNVDSTLSFDVVADSNEVHRVTNSKEFMRIRFTNSSASPQTYFRLQTMQGMLQALNLSLNREVTEDTDALVTRTIDELAIISEKIQGQRIISKFGRNADVDAAEDIWDGGGDYTGFPTTTAEEFQVLSSSVNDTSAGTGARTVRCYYLNSNYEMFDSTGAFLYFDVTLNGTTAVNSGVTGMRIWRAKVLTSGSGQTNAGTITVRWRTTTSVIFTVMVIGTSRSELGSFTIPSGYKGYLKRYSASMLDNTANSAQMAIKVREFGSDTFRIIRPFAISTTSDVNRELFGADPLEEKEDLVFRALSVGSANAIITVSFGILLVKI